ncbi:MAG TPA: sulfite exporter TauE/SafE family protein [bacterium]|nr:sulfite exporter TauE/SafE family protein [bacterium]
MGWALIGGGVAGLVLGLFGAGGTVVGLPLLLQAANLSSHGALGTNALGVALVALVLLALRWRRGDTHLTAGIAFALPGMLGTYAGANLGLIVPGARLVFLLGLLVLLIAGWVYFSSTRLAGGEDATDAASGLAALRVSGATLWRLMPTAFVVGLVSGFFAVGGGFMIVPALMFILDIDVAMAAGIALVPIAVFAGTTGLRYLSAGQTDLTGTAGFLAVGALTGFAGLALARVLPRRRLGQALAVALLCVGAYLLLH